ncbi:hypothetical protein PspLS_07691, partial [Pyricularia sp. CBS 133598]
MSTMMPGYNGSLKCQSHNRTTYTYQCYNRNAGRQLIGKGQPHGRHPGRPGEVGRHHPHAFRISRRTGRDLKDNYGRYMTQLTFYNYCPLTTYIMSISITVYVTFWRQAIKCDRLAEASWTCLARVVQTEMPEGGPR